MLYENKAVGERVYTFWRGRRAGYGIALWDLLFPAIFYNVNVAYTTGYVISFIVNFYLTSYFTFGTTPSWKKLVGMGGAHLVNYLLHIILLNVFLYLGVSKAWAPVPVFAIAIPVNFLFVRFVFKHKKL